MRPPFSMLLIPTAVVALAACGQDILPGQDPVPAELVAEARKLYQDFANYRTSYPVTGFDLSDEASAAFDPSERDAAEVQELTDQLAHEFAGYRSAWRDQLEEGWEDRHFGDLALTDGTELENVRFAAIEASGIRVFHSQGGRFIEADELPEDVRDECGFHPADAHLRHERLQASREVIAQWKAQEAEERAAGNARRRARLDAERNQQSERLEGQIEELRSRARAMRSQASQIRINESRSHRSNYTQADRLDWQASRLEREANGLSSRGGRANR